MIRVVCLGGLERLIDESKNFRIKNKNSQFERFKMKYKVLNKEHMNFYFYKLGKKISKYYEMHLFLQRYFRIV